MRVKAERLGAKSRARLCALALCLAALAQGCVQPARAPVGGGTAATPEARHAQATPAPPAQATPAAESQLPQPEGFVNDFAEVLDDATESRVEARLGRLKGRTKIEIGVVTVETTGAQSVFEYSLALARTWGIGPPAGEEGGGILVLIAVKDRKWQIQVTRSLEADLGTDVVSAIGGRMLPYARAGDYGEAVEQCLDGLVARLAERRGFPTEEDESRPQAPPEVKTTPAAKPKAGAGRKSTP